MNKNSSLLLVVFWLIYSPAAIGQIVAPFIEFTSGHREVDVLASWMEMPPGMSDGDFGDKIYTQDEYWNDDISLNFGLAESRAEQNSDIGNFSISGDAETYARVSETVYGGNAGALSSISASFTLPIDIEFLLTASFEFEGASTTGWSRGQVLMSGINEQGIFQHEVDSEDPDTWNSDFSGTITAGNPVFVIFLVHAQRGKDIDLGNFETGESTAKMQFSLDFGDRDHDGLLNKWEIEDEIDLGGGAVIDLSPWDPDPDVKDLFVEVDILHDSGMNLETQVFPHVIESFSKAPAEAVDNYDNSPGVNLHVLVDEVISSRPEAILTLVQPAPPNGPWVLPPAFHTFKNGDMETSGHMGTQAIRSGGHWKSGLEDIWKKIFRYALWVDKIQKPVANPPGCVGPDFRFYGGWAGGTPGNDFAVAAGHIRSQIEDNEHDIPADVKFAFAGAFMHELGHTLGLRHGGGSFDVPNLKTNYLSVMNYAYGNVFPKKIDDDTNGRIAFLLDYSRNALETLDENSLIEDLGLAGPVNCNQPQRPEGSKCRILFSPKLGIVSQKPELAVANASSSEIDWNGDETISSELIAPVDLNRFSKTDYCTQQEIKLNFEVLTSHSDWDQLKFAPPKDSSSESSTAIFGLQAADEMDHFMYEAIMDAEWVDQDPFVSPLIFKDSFEQ